MCLRVQSFCLCKSVEEGSKLIAWTVIVVGLVTALISLFKLLYPGLTSGAVAVLFGAVLLYGVLSRRRAFLIIWLIISLIVILAQLSYFVYCVNELTRERKEESIKADDDANPIPGLIIEAILAFVNSALQIYFWIVVYSFNLELKDVNLDG